MRIAILKTSKPSAVVNGLTPANSSMIRQALGASYTYREFDVEKGELPPADVAIDAFLVLGSASSVYDRHPWIERLREWLAGADPETPMVGICFGHQIMASAFGGRVERARQGLAVGLHRYEVHGREGWMDDGGGSMADADDALVLPVAHYDQVTHRPPTARVVASNAFSPHAVLSYTDRRAISFQAHPEYSLELTATRIGEFQRAGMLDDAEARNAQASMQLPDDRARTLGWIRRFLDGHSRN